MTKDLVELLRKLYVFDWEVYEIIVDSMNGISFSYIFLSCLFLFLNPNLPHIHN